MNKDIVFRVLMFLAFVAMMTIRIYYQSRIFREKRGVDIKEGKLSLMAGAIAALTSIVFGAEYIFTPGVFGFAYALRYPDWVRWLGCFLLIVGITLLGLAHHHLGKSFSSFVVSKEDQLLVETGPYRRIRHPIYSAYILNYLGGGLLASNWVLTVIPVLMFGILVAIRMGQEEKVMEESFGQAYIEYEKRTGRLIPRMFGNNH
ncbi:MAG: isoprenylcysteine carboxylmethyltransferase family protein [Anaerolineales bacterium]|nr:isoprenylcysteine carboxylmethyltransferase family protein [Anaerolineales bacterium]